MQRQPESRRSRTCLSVSDDSVRRQQQRQLAAQGLVAPWPWRCCPLHVCTATVVSCLVVELHSQAHDRVIGVLCIAASSPAVAGLFP